MRLTSQQAQEIIDAVQSEPKTIQDIAHILGVSWVTAEKYVQYVVSDTGRIAMKVFRPGTQAALKIVYSCSPDFSKEGVEASLRDQIERARNKKEFDFFELYQYAVSDSKSATVYEEGKQEYEHILKAIRESQDSLYIFSGNMSFLQKGVYEALHDALKKGVRVKILCRVTFSSLRNLSKIADLLEQYNIQLEIHHLYQPLRGFICDESKVLFWGYEHDFEKEEMDKKMRVLYQVADQRWVKWLTKIFWKQFRFAIPYQKRVQELKKI